MTPGFADHAFVALLAIGLPALVATNYQRFKARARAGGAVVRIRQYMRTILLQWGLVAALALSWTMQGREVPLDLPTGRELAWGVGLLLLGLGALGAQLRAIGRLTPDEYGGLRSQLAGVEDVMPRTDRELAWFRGLCLTAGTCEEVLFRGFLMWYLAPMVGVWGAVVASSAIFGIGHAYQGLGGVLKTGVVGLAMAGVYVAGGTLLWPMVLHAAIDLQGGAVARRVLAH